MNLQERQQFWQQQVDTWQTTDLSGAAFCKQQGLNYQQFIYWRKKSQQPETTVKPAGFAQVTQLTVPTSRNSHELNIHLPSGISFSGINTGNLDIVLALLRKL